MKKWKMYAMALGIFGLSFGLTACGSSEGKEANVKQEAKEWVYVPEFTELEDETASYYNMKFAGSDLYYESYSYDEETGESSQSICRYTLADGSTDKVNVPLQPSESGEDGSYNGQSINAFTVTEDGSVVVVFNNYKNDANGNYESWMELAKFDAEGNELFRKNLKDAMGEDEENSYVRNILIDDKGRFYLPADSKIWLFDTEGNSCGAAEMSAAGGSWINGSGVGKDGKVYICYYSYDGNSGSYCLAEVDFDKRALGTTYANFPGGNGETLSAGTEKDFITHDGTAVYEYDLATQTGEKLFDWLDSDINGSFVQSIGVLEDGRILAIIQDWENDDNSIALLKKTPASQVAQKEQILIGSMSGGSDLQAAAVKFNRNSDKYHISIKTYLDYNNWNENSWNDAITNLNNDLTSKNCPDIIDLNGLDIEQLASKGLFEDLNPYLVKSTVLAKEDYLENILNAYTYDGKLICIPGYFEMQTVIGRTSDVGSEMGWTLAELIAYADAHPGAAIFDGMTKEYMLQYCMMYNEDSFIDWKKADCNFDTQEFKDLLSFVNRFPEEYEWSEDDASEATKIQNGEVLLSNAYIYDFDQIQLYYEMFGGEITCIGFPTADGSAGCALQAGNTYAIISKSKEKEAAWSFIESYLDGMKDSENHYLGFPTNKEELDKMAEEAVKVEYVLDEDGNKILDENGEPIVEGTGSGIGYQDGWSYTFRIPTQEEVDLVMELMNVAKPVSYNGNSEVLKIINEEAAAYFSGQKSVDEVASIIQSRIKIYVSENS